MRLGVFARTFEGASPRQVLERAAQAGFAAVHYNFLCSGLPPIPDRIGRDTVTAIESAAARTGSQLIAVSGTYNMIHPDRAVREDGHRRLRVIAEAAGALGIPLISLCTGSHDPDNQWRAHPDNMTEGAWRDLLASMAIAIPITEDHGLDLGIEPELGNVVNSAPRARRLVDELQSPRLKIIIDPANLFEQAPLAAQHDIVARSIDLLADRVVMGHAKDRTEMGAFTTAGKGVLDYAHYFACLGRIAFDGPVVAHGLSAPEAPAVAQFLSRHLAEAGIPAINRLTWPAARHR